MEEEKLTQQQMKALWLFFTLVADGLNKAGLDMRKVFDEFKKGVDVSWNKQSVHDYLWIPFQKAILHKKSTTELKKQEDIDKVYDSFNKSFGEIFGFYQEFPSLDRVMTADEEKKLKQFYASE